MELKAVENPKLSRKGEPRYVLIDLETGEIVDDAQGYGYKTAQGAHLSWAYQHRDKSKDAEKKAKSKKIRKWMKEHKGFVKQMDGFAFEIEYKGSWGPEDHFDAAFVKQMLEDHNLHPDFTAAELLREWRKI